MTWEVRTLNYVSWTCASCEREAQSAYRCEHCFTEKREASTNAREELK